MYCFDAKKVCSDITNWIKNWFDTNGKGCKAVVGISGGKDSSVVTALCVRALGKENVVGVLMPCGIQPDIDYSKDLVDFLNIKHVEINVKAAIDGLLCEAKGKVTPTVQASNNLPARIRMATLYLVAQSLNGRVANTCNLSEDWVGYSTRYGDNAGDFSPICHLTVTEVKELGRFLGLPEKFIVKPPIDGLCGKTDEENLGFTYAVLDKYIREGIEPSAEIKISIDAKHKANLFKLKYMDCFEYNPTK